VRCGTVRLYGMRVCECARVRVCEGAVFCTFAVQCWCGIRRWQATRCLAGGSHPWIWGAPRSRVLHDLEFAIVLLVIGASHHHRRVHGPPTKDHSRPVTLAPYASSIEPLQRPPSSHSI
jgi:hypothetical protein